MSMRAGSCQRRCVFTIALVGAFATFISIAAPLLAQRSRPTPPSVIILRGTIVRQDSVTPAPYSSVELVEAHARHFSDENGHFSFKVPPGRYHVLVRQLGFIAHDTVLQLSERSPPPVLLVRMVAATIRLSEIAVRVSQLCSAPGIDSSETPILAEFMADVRENAHREMILRHAYPFEYTVEDVQTSVPESVSVSAPQPARTLVDTLGYRSDALMPYRRGNTIFTDRTDPRGAWERMRLPSTLDFADTTFLATHCFDYGVAPSGDYEINFRPLAAITTPDVEGTVTLDSLTFVIRSAVVRLTHASDVAPGYERMEIRTTYREVLPRVALPDVVASVQRYRTPFPDERAFIATETQSMRTLRFLKRAPDGVAREQLFAAPAEGGAGLSSSLHRTR